MQVVRDGQTLQVVVESGPIGISGGGSRGGDRGGGGSGRAGGRSAPPGGF
jgi:hypothetical protein